MEVEESVLMEVGMYSHGHVVTDTHHSSKGIGTQTHVGILTHHLETLALLLHRIGIIAETIDLNSGSLDLTALACALALYQCSFCTDASTCGDLLQHLLIKLTRIDYHLYVLNRRTIIQSDKVYGL